MRFDSLVLVISIAFRSGWAGGNSFLHQFEAVSLLPSDDINISERPNKYLLKEPYEPLEATDSDESAVSSTGLTVSDDPLIQDLARMNQKNLLKTGTTIVGMCCSNGVVLAADTRSTGGPLVMDKTKLKIHQVARLIYCCAAGTSADCDQLTREAKHALQLLALETAPNPSRAAAAINSYISADPVYFDPVNAALLSISRSQSRKRGGSGDAKSSVLIMGGIDGAGPSLHTIDADGVYTQVSFAALGSGSTDAIAVLEDFLHRHHSSGSDAKSRHTADERDGDSSSQLHCGVEIEEAVGAVRRAVLAGITNDLGSGSYVDFCVIEPSGVRRWREAGPCCEPLTASSASQSQVPDVKGVEDDGIPVAPHQVLHDNDTSRTVSLSLKRNIDVSFV